ncbi:MAG: hypothetical protein M3401_01930 [Actinomycetota bacterium]|nr:hypothetical protein [Actinomycetota bacterium]
MNNNIDLGRVVREVFDIYRDQAGVLLPVALVVFAVDGLIRGALTAISPILGLTVGFIISLTAVGLYRGMVVQLVADVQDGRRDSSVADLFQSVVPVLVPLILASLLFGLGVGVGLLLLIVPGLFLATIWAVVSPVVVLEQPGVIASFDRSRKLVRGHAWQVFGVVVIFIAIFIVVAVILGAIGAALGGAGSVIAGIISSVLTAPLVALAGTVLYFHLRAMHGGLGAPAGATSPGAMAGGTAQPQPGVGAGSHPADTSPASGPAQPASSPQSPGQAPGSPQSPASSSQSPAQPSPPGQSAQPGRPGGEPGPGQPT